VGVWRYDESIYQVDPSLFLDTDGDGWGDLRGIERKLPYIRSLGIGTLWILPFYCSPFRDHGYDVTDHLRVDPRFGDIADFVSLLEHAERLGMRVVIDLVMQHTSIDHPWFQSARSDRNSPYRNYYVWSDEPVPGDKPAFAGVEDGVWTWDASAGQYYRHQFYSHEPDLDHANPEVREEMYRVMSYWLRLGISGFRVDAAPHIAHRACIADDTADGLWIIEDMHRYARRRVHGAVLMGEADVDVEKYRDWLADGRRLTHLLDFFINNHLFLALARGRAGPLQEALRTHGDVPLHARHGMWLRNHDQLDLDQLTEAEVEEVRRAFAPDPDMWAYGRGIRRRLAPMLGGELDHLALAHAVLASLPGVPILRYGDEIGMGEDLSRPEREAVRTPMQWTPRANGGFSDAARSELVAPPIDDGPFAFVRVNVEDQRHRSGSLLARVRRMLHVRLELEEFRGAFREARVDDDRVLALRYDDDAGGCLLTLCNLSADEVRFAVEEPDNLRVVEVLADRQYPDADLASMVLGRYGYRWLHCVA
jgi:maltose alpha-D-glucosyltransferase / alpha-amylase